MRIVVTEGKEYQFLPISGCKNSFSLETDQQSLYFFKKQGFCVLNCKKFLHLLIERNLRIYFINNFRMWTYFSPFGCNKKQGTGIEMCIL